MSDCWKLSKKLTFGTLIPLFFAAASSATTFTVTNTSDSGTGSLRGAINSAGAGDTIVFSLSYPATISVTSGPLLITQNLTIVGPGSASLSISGNNTSTVVSVSGGNVNISGVTITGGGFANTLGGNGGGISNSGTLTLSNCTVSGNSAFIYPLAGNKGLGYGGGIYNSGTLTMSGCSVSGNTVSGNSSVVNGGGIYNMGTLTISNGSLSGNSANGDAGANGGGIYNAGTLIVTNSVLTNNFTEESGGAIYNASGTLMLIDSTVSGNLAGGAYTASAGGGIYNGAAATVADSTLSGNSCSDNIGPCDGGGVYNAGTLTMANSTLSGNSATSLGGAAGGGIYNNGQLTLSNDTLSGNSVNGTPGSGPGIVSTQIGFLTMKGTILANSQGNCSITAGGYAVSNGYNLSNDTTCSTFLNNTGDLNNTPAGLDPNGLQNNGGPTQTIALLPGSPAIDAIPVNGSGYCTAADGVTVFPADQRSVVRPQQAACDIGAFELTTSAALLTIAKYQTTGLALSQQGATYTIVVSNAPTAGSTSGTVTVSDTLPNGLALASMSGSGWTCASNSCTRSDVLAAGTSYPPISVGVNVAANAISPLINTATVSGGSSAAGSASVPAIVMGDPVLSITKTHTGSFALSQQAATYTLTVTNALVAGPTSGTVTVTDNLPTGLNLVSMTGTGWSCSNNSCTRNDVLAAGASYPTITVIVNVGAQATSPQINMATVSGGGWATSGAADYTTVTGTPVLSITKSHSGNFALGEQGASYTITVSNASGAGPTTGPVSVSDTLPNGLSLVTIGGLGWSCAGVTCSRNDALAAGATYSPITVNVNVAAHASTPQINVATVSGGGAATVSTSDSTTITGAPILSITKTHTGNFLTGQQGATYTLTVSNSSAGGPTSGTVSVSDTVPGGLTLVSMAGSATGWSCTGNTCTRGDVLGAGASYPPITVTVNVATTATSPQINYATVSGGGSTAASTSNSTTIIPASLSIAKTHSGIFSQGQQGVYTVTVSNASGAGSTSGTVTVTDTLPSGLTLASMSGTGWSCASATCTRNDPLAPGAGYPAITVMVNVSPTVASMVTNMASVSGGGSSGASASDPTSIAPPVYAISGTVTLNGTGLNGVTITLTGTFSGTVLTNGSGAYSFGGLVGGGTYTVAASLAGYSFTGPFTLSNLSANGTANFIATVQPGSEVGVFRTGNSYLQDSNGNRQYDSTDVDLTTFIPPGGFMSGDQPVTGDWSGNGHWKVGVYRPSSGTWWLDTNGDGTFDAGDLGYPNGTQFGGIAGDLPVTGDWTNQGKSCIGIFRSGYVWLLDLNCNGTYDGTPADAFFPFGGLKGDMPVTGNWVAGQPTRVGVVRAYAPGGVVGACNSSSNAGCPFFWVLDGANPNAGTVASTHQPAPGAYAYGGLFGDVFVTGDWLNLGYYRAGVYRGGIWLLDEGLNGASNHTYDTFFGYGGLSADVPIVGKW